MSMRYSRTTASRGAHRHHIHDFRRSALALGIALLIAGPAMAQDAGDKEKATDLDKVTDIKREADTFVDSVTALDIGALADRSVT